MALLFHSKGSSPRMRGTHLPIHPRAFSCGIIPAYAGNTWKAANGIHALTDHPRVCGEHTLVRSCQRSTVGSSPRMRGTPDLLRELVDDLRIIPAYAGNTVIWFPFYFPNRDHPRVCGEHVLCLTGRSMTPGSSPRMRGTLGQTRHFAHEGGIIPAYAGNTN